MRRAGRIVAALLTLAIGACRGGETGPVAGELVVRVTPPGHGERAVYFRLAGVQNGIAAPPGSGYRVYTTGLPGDTALVIVVAPLGSAIAPGDLLRFSVPDTRRVDHYAAILIQMAGADYRLESAGPDALTVTRP
jgi:hypothetical protein